MVAMALLPGSFPTPLQVVVLTKVNVCLGPR